MKNFNKTILLNSVIISLSAFGMIGCDNAKESANYQSNSVEKSIPSTESVSYKMSADMSESPDNNSTDEQVAIENEQTATHELQSGVVNQQVAGKKLLISANAQFNVKDVVASVRHIEALTQQSKGYIASSRIDNDERGTTEVIQGDKVLSIRRYVRYSEMTVRIPKENIEQFLKSLQKEIQFLQHSEFTAEDVTLDIQRQQLQAQLSGEQVNELQQERLNAKKADDQNSNVNTINSTYDVKRQQALANIERKVIEDKLKYSVIQLSFSQPEALYQSTRDNIQQVIASHEPSLKEQMQERLMDGWQVFKQVISGVVQLWWLWLTILFSVPVLKVVWGFWKWIWRKMTFNNTVQNPSKKLNKKVTVKSTESDLEGDKKD